MMSDVSFTLSPAGAHRRDAIERYVRKGLAGRYSDNVIEWVWQDLARRFPWEPPAAEFVDVPAELQGFAAELARATCKRQDALTGDFIAAMIAIELESYHVLHRRPANDVAGVVR